MVTKRQQLLEKAKAGVKSAYSKKDLLIIQAIKSLDDIDSAKSLLLERLKEWFKFNFPEFDLQNEESYCKVIAQFGSKDDLDASKLFELVGEAAGSRILEQSEKSFGASFDLNDKAAVQVFAETVQRLFESRGEIEAYLKREADVTLKNLVSVIEPLVAVRLVAKAGGLERLAKMPASTIQLLGAEKALFKHLRSNTRPPKHGLIFQSNFIRNAPQSDRGKIARILATSLAIAAKADFYTQRFIGDALKERIGKRIAAIKKNRKEKAAVGEGV